MWKILGEFKKNKRSYYKVECDCGYIGEREKRNVDSGRSSMCKSCSAKLTANKTYYTNPFFNTNHFGHGWLTKTRFNWYKYGAERRGFTFNISLEDAWNLLEKQNHRCKLSNVVIGYGSASIDRIDSSKGYEKDNIQWIHRELNWMKGTLSQKRFIEWCTLVHANQQPS